jgi:AbiV family abortive infection protein
MAVTPQYILEGSVYSLEQCGHLIRDADALYRGGSYASAVVLAAFAREEFGRSTILRDLWQRACAGETFTAEQLQDACDDHVRKQRAGMASTTLRAHKESGIGKILEARMKNDLQSIQGREADAKLKKIDEIKQKRTPIERHEKRMEALYVEPISETEWNRPWLSTSQLAAHDFLEDARNDYSVRSQNGYVQPGSSNEILKQSNLDLHNALEQWSDRPTLERPPGPLPLPPVA